MAGKPHCRMCKRKVNEVSKNSKLCPACVVRKVKTNIRQLQKKKGKNYKRWKLGLLEAIKKQPM